jgi:superfamily II DNA or RNA helicase
MAELDRERLEEALRLISRRGGLRSPQREALAALELAFQQADINLHQPPLEIATAFEHMSNFSVSDSGFAEADFALATGVGKSRLTGAVIELMANAGLSRTFLVLSHRDLLNRRWRWTLEANSPKTVVPLMTGRQDYVVIDSAFDLDGRATDDSIVVIAQTVQTVTNPKSTWWQDARSDLDLREWLRERNDLVVIFDEAHHLQGDGTGPGWRSALSGLHAKVILGMTATPRGNRHILYEYSLSQLLVEAKYSKSVNFLVDTFASLSDERNDRTALDVGLQLLEAKKEYVHSLPDGHQLADWSPAMLVAASSVNEVLEAQKALVNEMGVDPARILAIASRITSDADLEKILNFDDPTNSEADIVVAAFMLDEGWDITRVAVIVPLRALNSITNAKQIIGRGLRLPAGKRLNDDKLDTLEVVIVGQDSLLEIKRETDAAFGSGTVRVFSRESISHYEPRPTFIEDEGVAASSLRFTVSLERATKFELVLPLLVPTDLFWGLPAVWNTESVELDLTRIVAHTGSLSVASGFELHGQITEVVKRVAERVDYMTPQTVLDVLGEWSQATGENLSGALSLSSVENLMREALDNSWFHWQDGGVQVNIANKVLNTTSEFDPELAAPKEATWATKRWWKGWTKSAYNMVRLDTKPEFQAAQILDAAQDVKWWLRNDPKLLRVSLPSHRFAPDFIVQTEKELLIIEVKGDNQLQGFLTPALMNTMNDWSAKMNQVLPGNPVRFEVIKGTEVESRLLGLLTPR